MRSIMRVRATQVAPRMCAATRGPLLVADAERNQQSGNLKEHITVVDCDD